MLQEHVAEVTLTRERAVHPCPRRPELAGPVKNVCERARFADHDHRGAARRTCRQRTSIPETDRDRQPRKAPVIHAVQYAPGDLRDSAAATDRGVEDRLRAGCRSGWPSMTARRARPEDVGSCRHLAEPAARSRAPVLRGRSWPVYGETQVVHLPYRLVLQLPPEHRPAIGVLIDALRLAGERLLPGAV